jgi:hypothetical protein
VGSAKFVALQQFPSGERPARRARLRGQEEWALTSPLRKKSHATNCEEPADNQPALPTAARQAEAGKMVHVHKAPMDEKDVPAIVGHLTGTNGANNSV